MLKRLFSVLLCFVTIIAVIPFTAVETEAANVIITLDPGHGGHDPGAVGARNWGGDDEKNYNLRQAKAAKERLEQYAGVTVYLTRSDDRFIELPDRPLIAYNNGSDAFISIHNNSYTSSSARGCVVFIPNNNYRPIKAKSTAIANAIMKRLMNDVGIPKNTDPYTNTDSSIKYPDGTSVDKYKVIRYSKIYGGSITASMIVESCFQSNQSDVQSFLLKPEKVTATGYAIADGIADYYGFKLGGAYQNMIDISSSESKGEEGNAVVIDKTLTKGVDNTLSVSGWSVHSDLVQKFEYKVGSGSWQTLDGTYRADVASVTGNAATINAFSKAIDISSLPSGSSTVEIRGLTKANEYYDIAKYNLFLIPAAGTTYMKVDKDRYCLNEPIKITAKGDASGAWVGLFGVNENPGSVKSYYWFEMHNGTVTVDDFLKNSTANDRAGSLTAGTYKLVAFIDSGYTVDPNIPAKTITLIANRHSSVDDPANDTSVAKGQPLYLQGWALHPDGLSSFNVCIDNSATYELNLTTRNDVLQMFPDYATSCADVHGFAHNLDTSVISVGTHTASIQAVTKNGEVFVLKTFTLTITPPPYDGEITLNEGSGVILEENADGKLILGIPHRSSVESITALFDGDYDITDAKGNIITDYVASGCLLKLKYEGAYYDTAVIIVDGDLNGDGITTAKDIIRAKKYVANNNVVCFERAADVNRDGKITADDFSIMANACVG